MPRLRLGMVDQFFYNADGIVLVLIHGAFMSAGMPTHLSMTVHAIMAMEWRCPEKIHMNPTCIFHCIR